MQDLPQASVHRQQAKVCQHEPCLLGAVLRCAFVSCASVSDTSRSPRKAVYALRKSTTRYPLVARRVCDLAVRPPRRDGRGARVGWGRGRAWS